MGDNYTAGGYFLNTCRQINGNARVTDNQNIYFTDLATLLVNWPITLGHYLMFVVTVSSADEEEKRTNLNPGFVYDIYCVVNKISTKYRYVTQLYN